jgi:hypothetical protein
MCASNFLKESDLPSPWTLNLQQNPTEVGFRALRRREFIRQDLNRGGFFGGYRPFFTLELDQCAITAASDGNVISNERAHGLSLRTNGRLPSPAFRLLSAGAGLPGAGSGWNPAALSPPVGCSPRRPALDCGRGSGDRSGQGSTGRNGCAGFRMVPPDLLARSSKPPLLRGARGDFEMLAFRPQLRAGSPRFFVYSFLRFSYSFSLIRLYSIVH